MSETRVFGHKKSLLGDLMARKYEKSVEPTLASESGRGSGDTVSNRELIHGVASSLFEATLTRFRASKTADEISIEEDFERYATAAQSESSDSFWKDENFRQDYESSVTGEAKDVTPKKSAIPRAVEETQEHFVDILLDKMISRILPEEFPEREHFTQRVNDPTRRRRDKLSATIFANNLKVLTAKMGSVFEFQDSVIRLLAWRNPSGTVTMLIVVTIVCFDPIFLTILPLLFVLYGLMIQGYTQRHSLRRRAYLSRNVYGKSLLVSLASGGKRTSWGYGDSVHEYDYRTGADDINAIRANQIKQSMEFVVNLRDLQNSMTMLVLLSNSLEKFIYGTAGFKEEHRSTALFLVGLIAIIPLWIAGRFINWSVVSSLSVWAVMLAIHPKLRPKLTKIVKQEQIEMGKEVLSRTERYGIILDEPPEERFVEIFEIYKQGITPHVWDFYLYSPCIFDPSDSFRKAKKPPPGTQDLDSVFAPATWSYERNTGWEIDCNIAKWALEWGKDLKVDEDFFLVDDSFKRRRLKRKVVRYARPARKPSYRM
ncbi:LAMI_0G02410g1_1 [Lachancea mirantina]|uniref:LAMI_0G02410g1_1 n=1 Tax=Lachancea mirantina TaxID=1230905 RepID=A0A1G4K7T5_9SACH|nr:LAMI_0G02410g1_1 [Lachancea mirantina]